MKEQKTTEEIAREHYTMPYTNLEAGIKMLTLEIKGLIIHKQQEKADEIFEKIDKMLKS